MIYIIIGGSCAGKTSFAVNSFVKGHGELVEKKDILPVAENDDCILLGKWDTDGRTKGTDKISKKDIPKFFEQIKKSHKQGKDVIVDGEKACNRPLFDKLLESKMPCKLYLIDVSPKKSIERNRKNNSTHSDSTLKAICTKSKNIYNEYADKMNGELVNSDNVNDFENFSIKSHEEMKKKMAEKNKEKVGALNIEYIDINSIKPYENNSKIHTPEQIEQIKKSIQDYGFNDPISIWNYGEIIEGHGRYEAAKDLGIEKIPVIKLDHLDDEARRAYMLVHNKLTMNTGFDLDVLNSEIEKILNYDMESYGFELDLPEMGDDSFDLTKYTQKIKIPQYEITGEMPELNDVVNIDKSNSLIEEIETANISDEEKEFLKIASYRHNVFHYGKIAEYYAHASKEMQELMEKSALVIIDIDNAIANGYVMLSQTIDELMEQEDDE